MNLQHINVKVFVEGDLTIDLERFIEVFHRWTAEQSLDELLIDVADYRHVTAGPAVVLVGHEADYAMDNAGGRFGLQYNRKSILDGSNTDRLSQAFRSAAIACQLLEAEFASKSPLKFSHQEFAIIVNDRATAPNTPETFETLKPELESFLSGLCGGTDFSIRPESEPRRRFGVSIKTDRAIDLAAIAAASV